MNNTTPEKKSNGTFINGKAQIVEMLQKLSAEEKEKLLCNIRIKNPALAHELSELSFSFHHLENFSAQEIFLISRNVSSEIFGMALKGTAPNFQKKLLKAMPRDYAEVAYQTLMTRMATEKRDTQKAQNKILGIALGLNK